MMSQQVRFQEALETVEALPLYQQEDLIDIMRRRLAERKRMELADQIRMARVEYARGEIRSGTVADLLNEVSDANLDLE